MLMTSHQRPTKYPAIYILRQWLNAAHVPNMYLSLWVFSSRLLNALSNPLWMEVKLSTRWQIIAHFFVPLSSGHTLKLTQLTWWSILLRQTFALVTCQRSACKSIQGNRNTFYFEPFFLGRERKKFTLRRWMPWTIKRINFRKSSAFKRFFLSIYSYSKIPIISILSNK